MEKLILLFISSLIVTTTLFSLEMKTAMNDLFGVTTSGQQTVLNRNIKADYLFDKKFTLNNVAYQSYFFYTQQVDDEGEACFGPSCDVANNIITYKEDRGAWRIVSKQYELFRSGMWGNPYVSFHSMFYPSQHNVFFLLDNPYIGYGISQDYKELLSYSSTDE